jgi:SAM-dependent methyltransferase
VKRANIPYPGPPSKALIDVVDELTSLSQYPVLDAGCGFGRNALALASRGLSVVCADRNRDGLNSLIRFPSINNSLRQFECEKGRLFPVLTNLKHSQWPFSQNCFGAIICVHFLEFDLFDAFHSSLVLSGHLYIETFGGHGGNYLDLPKAGQLRDLLSRHFRLAFYRERAVGPPGCGAVSVKQYLFHDTKISFRQDLVL